MSRIKVSEQRDADCLWGSEEGSLVLIKITQASLKCTEQSLRTYRDVKHNCARAHTLTHVHTAHTHCRMQSSSSRGNQLVVWLWWCHWQVTHWWHSFRSEGNITPHAVHACTHTTHRDTHTLDVDRYVTEERFQRLRFKTDDLIRGQPKATDTKWL